MPRTIIITRIGMILVIDVLLSHTHVYKRDL
jgi:hypothetical protein